MSCSDLKGIVVDRRPAAQRRIHHYLQRCSGLGDAGNFVPVSRDFRGLSWAGGFLGKRSGHCDRTQKRSQQQGWPISIHANPPWEARSIVRGFPSKIQ